jgi:diacylglycerol kinase (ATP)
MIRRPPPRSAVWIAVILLLAVVGWTVLTLSVPAVARLDVRLLAPPLDEGSALAQIAAAFALLTWPGLVYASLAGVALWAWQRRQRQLGVALLLVIPLGWGGSAVFKRLVARDRPDRALDVLTAHGYAYPSGHLTAVVATAIAVGAVFAVTRQPARKQLAWQVGAGLLVLVVALDRWVTGAHWVSDLVGGILFGALVATTALIVSGVHVPLPQELVTEIVRARTPTPTPEDHVPRRAAVIYNPVKVTDWVTFRRHVEWELRSRGWERALFLETTPEDAGHAMTAQAVAEDVDLVLGAGGDGTIRVICAGLAHTGIPFGLIPAGTGNLLARNLGIPLDESAALDVAFEGEDKPVDLVALTVDQTTSHHFAVMAGIGIDAVIMDGTNADLKRAVGSAAYFVSAAQHANHPALEATIQVDDGEPLYRRAHVIVIGNVGYLQANIPLIPDAKPDDGLLDVLVASPRSVRDWVRVTTRVLTRRRRGDEQLDRLTGRRVTITVDHKEPYQMDGDTAGACSTMEAEVRPGALLMRVPRAAAAARRTSAELVEVREAEEAAGAAARAG